MKILHTRHTNYTDPRWTDMDHVSDLIMHGLVMLGHEVTDAPKLWTVYRGFGEPGKSGPNPPSAVSLHGRGFTLTRNVPDETHIDRSDIPQKIQNQYFDLIVLARADFGSPYEDLIWEHYPASKIIIIDGKDMPNLTQHRDVGFMIGKGSFFKRELTFDRAGVFPISCSFPQEKALALGPIHKTQLWSVSQPVVDKNQTPYTFNSEQEYYEEYSRSLFGLSYRKYPWWEYERHYEIIASGAIPVIPDLRDCPEQSLTFFPKEELLAVNQLLDDNGPEWFVQEPGIEIYKILQQRIFKHFMQHCTTEAMAKYMLDTHVRNFNLELS